jgi:chromosome condensin MukBEF complex kleisin-like MukF subunit
MKYVKMLKDEFKALSDAANPSEDDTAEVRWYMSVFTSLTYSLAQKIETKIDAFKMKAQSAKAIKGFVRNVLCR